MTNRTADLVSSYPFLRPRSDKIFIPRHHGEVLVEPPVAAAVNYLQTRHNADVAPQWWLLRDCARKDLHALLPDAGRKRPQVPSRSLDGKPVVSDVVGHEAGGPLVITGHQVEFYHAGVWAKVLLANALAQQTGGTAVDILVDHDTVDHLGLALPEKTVEGEWHKTWHTWAPGSAVAADGLAAPAPQIVMGWCDGILQSAAEGGVINSDALKYFLNDLRTESHRDYVSWLDWARTTFEQKFGLHVHHVRSGALCQSSAWLAFVALWMSNYAQWTAIYNRAIEDYRQQHHIKSPARPMPPLAISSDVVELPFWIYRRGAPRDRLSIKPGDHPIIMRGSQLIDLPPTGKNPLQTADQWRQTLDALGLCIRPRALTLTLYVRTFLADLFIHGIGGAMYDEMADQIASQIGLPIGGYLCASAGWLLTAGQTNAINERSPSELKMRRHHLKHNPQLLYQSQGMPSVIDSLLAERRDLIAALALRPHHSDLAARTTRRKQFARLHLINAQCHQYSDALVQMDRAIAEAQSRERQAMVLGDREYCFPLHGWDSLRQLQYKIADI